MLINARVPEEIRIAIIEGPTLENYQVEVAERGLTRGNIYRGTIVSIQPSLNAAFIDYGAERHGFLAIQDVVPAAYYRKPDGSARPRIEGVLERGRSIVVQVTREPEGTKGAALTTNLSLAGRSDSKSKSTSSIAPMVVASLFAPTLLGKAKRP
jgi:ribonuclease E